MASRGLPDAAGPGLSVEAAHFFARVYGPARAGCLAQLRWMGCREEEAEDIFAATFERIMRKHDPTRSGHSAAQTVSLLKKACREKLLDERAHRDVLKLVSLRAAEDQADETAESPPEAAEEREAVATGREAIASLSERDRALFLQRHQLNLEPEEILRRNPGLSQRTYRKLIQRANTRALEAYEQIGSGRRCAEMRREHLRHYVAGEASDGELAVVQSHLSHCRACRREVARMRGHLREVASGLAAALSADSARGGALAELPARLLDAVLQGGQGLAGATRAARERLRELAIRVATGLPGGGGEAAGQLAGISGAKAVSACAAGALAAGCLAAGVVPGVGALDLAGHARHRDRPPPAASRRAAPEVSTTTPRASTGASQSVKPSSPRSTKNGTGGAGTASESRPRASDPSRASGRQVGTEFGLEAAGTGSPTATAGGEESSGSSSSAGEAVAPSRSAGKPDRSGSAVAAEFGL